MTVIGKMVIDFFLKLFNVFSDEHLHVSASFH